VLDLSLHHRPRDEKGKLLRTQGAIVNVKHGDVFKDIHAEKYFVVARAERDWLWLLWFLKGPKVAGPYDYDERERVDRESFAKRYITGIFEEDKTTSALSCEIVLVSRGLIAIDRDWTCAACPIIEQQKRRLSWSKLHKWINSRLR